MVTAGVTWTKGDRMSDEPRLWDPESVDGTQGHLGVVGLIEQWDRFMFGYVVVEERAGGVVSLELSPWPHLDEWGRPSFEPASQSVPWSDDDGETTTVVPVVAEGGMDRLRRQRFGVEVEPRAVEVGDVYGVAIDPKELPDPPGRLVDEKFLTHLFVSPLYDVTAEAQELARIALAASASPPLEHEQDSTVVIALRAADEPEGPEGPEP